VQCNQGLFIFFWIEFVPVILYLEFCMSVDRAFICLQVFKNFWKTAHLICPNLHHFNFICGPLHNRRQIVTTASMSELNWPQWHVIAPMGCRNTMANSGMWRHGVPGGYVWITAKVAFN
jgi:hypothetical protein